MSIQKPTYIGCDNNTFIKDIPSIINKNNEENNRLFGDIFEFGNDNANQQYIKVPVITDGLIKGNSGQFYNLYSNKISFSNESIAKDFQNIITNHNKSLNRFSSDDIYNNYINTSFTHDAASIVFEKNKSVEEVIKELKNSIKNVTDINDKYETRFSTIEKDIEDIKSLLETIVTNLNINNEKNEMTTTSQNINENEELIKVLNESTSSYTYSSSYYKK